MIESRILEWDSEFFKKKIARIDANDCPREDIEAEIDKYKSLGIDLIYLFMPHNQYDFGTPIDTKVIYTKKLSSAITIDERIQVFNAAPELLYDLAYQSGGDSRFRRDERFGEEDFRRLYRCWIDNSVNGKLADRVMIYEEDGIIKGFITSSIKDTIQSIGLLAVDSNHRSSGIGRKLINAAENYGFSNSVEILTVATQKSNTTACSFYEKCGFAKDSMTDIFHIWIN